MDYTRYAKWLTILLLLLALVTIPLLQIRIPLRLRGTVFDTSSEGYSMFLQALRARHHVYLSLPDPNAASGAALLILDPRFCYELFSTKPYTVMLAEWIAKAKPRQIIIIGDHPCTLAYLNLFADVKNASLQPRLVMRIDDVEVDALGVLVVDADCGGVECRGGLIETVRGGIQVVFIGDSDFLRNRVVDSHPEYLRVVADLVNYDPVVVFVESETSSVAIPFSPYLLTLAVLSYLSSLERYVSRSLPFVLAVVYTLIAGILAQRLILRESSVEEERIYARPEPPRLVGVTRIYERVVRGRRLTGGEARILVARLYEILDAAIRYRVGVGIDGVLRSTDALARLSSISGWSSEKLESLLRRVYRLGRKARGESRLPIVLRWGRATRLLMPDASTLLKNLGVELDKLRGLEVLLEYGELAASETAGREGSPRDRQGGIRP